MTIVHRLVRVICKLLRTMWGTSSMKNKVEEKNSMGEHHLEDLRRQVIDRWKL